MRVGSHVSNSLHQGQTVYLRVEIGGSLTWRAGYILDSNDSAYTVCVGLKAEEFEHSGLKVGEAHLGRVSAGAACLLVKEPPGVISVAMPPLRKIQQAYFRKDEDEEAMFLSTEEVPDLTESNELARLREENRRLLEQVQKQQRGRGSKAPVVVPVVDDEDEDAEEDEEDGELDDLLDGMESLWLAGKSGKAEVVDPLDQELFGKVSTTASVKSLPVKRPVERGLPASSSARPSVAPTASRKVSTQDLVMLEMLQTLRELRKDRIEREEDEDGTLSSNQSKSISRTMRAYREMKERVHREPRAIVKDYVQEVKEELGVTGSQVWSLRDFAKRVQWGKFRSFQKFFEMQVAIWELLQAGDHMAAWAQCTQNLKSVHQATLDFGSWRHAWPLTGLNDPAERRRFGGSAREMETVNQLVKTLDELDKRVKQNGNPKNQKDDGE